MKTSRFKNIGILPDTYIPISVSRFPPSWYVGKQYQDLAPSAKLLMDTRHDNLSYDEYLERFRLETLSKLDPEKVYNHLNSFGKEPVILCFEDLTIPNEWCHRRIIADWFNEHLNVFVPEFEKPPKNISRLIF